MGEIMIMHNVESAAELSVRRLCTVELPLSSIASLWLYFGEDQQRGGRLRPEL